MYIYVEQWKKYLKSISTYSYDDYLEAINQCQVEYSSLIKEMEQCLSFGNENGQQNDPNWIERMVKHFGPENLKKKQKSILINFKMLIAGSDENCCGEQLEKLFYKEAVLYGAYKYYINSFLDFYKEQSPPNQEILKSRKESADKILSLISRGAIERTFISLGKPTKQLSEIQAKKADEEIYYYFKEHAPKCKNDYLTEIDKMKKAINMQR